MDIFLVNSGPSDFWKPSPADSKRALQNNRNGTFTDVTEVAGVGGSYFGMGRPSATMTTTAGPTFS